MNGKRVMKTKKPVALLALLLLLCCTVAGTLAYLVTNTDPVTNTFTPAEVKTEVTESFVEDKGELVKSNVQIKNNGNIDAYIRAAVIINWADANGNVYGGGTPVEGTDYTAPELQNGWIKVGDYYYYTSAVPAGSSTGTLFAPIEQLTTCKDTNYGLQITILADGIQSVPDTVVKDVWKVVEVKGGQLAAVGTNG